MEESNYIIAIDLGSSNVAVAVGRKGGDGKLLVEAAAVRESKGVVKGEVKNVELAAASIREAVDQVEGELGISIKEACMGISGAHIKCAKHPYYVYVAGKDGEIAEEDVRRLNESMRNVQAPDGFRLLHIIPQHYIVNEDEEVADPVGMFGKTLGSTFNLIIGETNIVSRLDKAFQKVGIAKGKLFINPLVAAEAVTFPDEKELGVAVVDMGAGTTDICIYQDGIVRYVNVIPMGADAINKDIRSYGIMERYVEELKTKYGCAVAAATEAEKLIKVPGRTPHDHKEISFRNLASIIEARLTDITEYITAEIKASGYEGRLAAGIILTGGGACMTEIKSLVEQKTGLEVRIAAPDINVSADSPVKADDPRLSSAIGILSACVTDGVTSNVKPGVKRAVEPEKPQQKEESDVPRARLEPTQRPAPKPVEPEPEKSGAYTEEDFYDAGKRPKEPKEDDGRPKKGLFRKLREKFEKTFDFDVLDDDDTI